MNRIYSAGSDAPRAASVGVIVLAGDRGANDPVARDRRVASKALAPVRGRAMLTRVLDALADLEEAGTLVLVAGPQLEGAAAASRFPGERIRWVTPAASPSRSVALALETLAGSKEVLLVTADHPLLEAAWLRRLLALGRAGNAELAVALVPWQRVRARFPESRRTRYRFRDGAVCGTNLFLFRGPRARRITDLWQEVEAQRKRPWRIVSLIGTANLLRYLFGRLSLNEALERLSRRLDFNIQPVLLDAAESAVDVDSRADLRCVEAVLAAREPADAAD